jgi:hypothetical protein
MDLPAEGKSPREALGNLLDIARVQVESAIDEENLESIYSAAPPELWRRFAEARDFADRPRRPTISHVDSLTVREAVAADV